MPAILMVMTTCPGCETRSGGIEIVGRNEFGHDTYKCVHCGTEFSADPGDDDDDDDCDDDNDDE